MKPLTAQEAETLRTLLFRCTEILKEGFRVDLSADRDGWAALSRALGSKRLCGCVAGLLCDAYRTEFSEAFLFSERCVAFEFRYHLNAYLWTKGCRKTRHVSTLLLNRAALERKCRSVEIDTNDVYRRSQRIAFRYFCGIRKEYRKTARDPYAKQCGGRYLRIPFCRF